MRKGFTLLELVVVIIILGILGTLGTSQYFSVVERSRGSEAKIIFGQIRFKAAQEYSNEGNLSSFTNSEAGIGDSTYPIPSTCRDTHFFNYSITTRAASNLTVVATRCTASGKTPNAPTTGTITLKTDFDLGNSSITSAPIERY